MPPTSHKVNDKRMGNEQHGLLAKQWAVLALKIEEPLSQTVKTLTIHDFPMVHSFA